MTSPHRPSDKTLTVDPGDRLRPSVRDDPPVRKPKRKAPPKEPKPPKRVQEKEPPKKKRGWFGRAVVWTLTLAVWVVVGIGAVFAWYSADLPDISEATKVSRRPSLTFLSADGEAFATYGDIYGDPVTLSEVPKWLPQAIIATEDRRFYEHMGVDPVGLARAAFVNLRAGRVVQGGSTITQQLAKNLFLTPERSLKRKIQELVMAFWLEQTFTKEQILTLYLNRVYLGAGTFGIDAASRRYFDIPAGKLSLYRSALLAGLLKGPTRYNPLNNPDLARQRTEVVLANMVAAGFITADQAKGAAAAGPGPLRHFAPGGRYFADWLYEQVEDYAGAGRLDVVAETTLDMRLQRAVEAELAALLDGPGAKAGVTQGAVVILSPDGAIRAMAGGHSYAQSQFNRATQAQRQPGSAFKPFLYLAAVESGMSPEDVVEDAPVRIGKWKPDNYDGKYLGPISLREAAARSSNVVAARLIDKLGPRKVTAAAQRLGITSPMPNDASLALGTGEVSLLELTTAYAAFANGGLGAFSHGLSRIRDDDGRILWRRDGGGPGRVIGAGALARMNELLSAVVESGTGKAAAFGHPAAGKTGTTSDYKDAWFIGYTAHYVAGVWLGNDDGTPMKRVTGGSLPAQLWAKVMAAAHQKLPVQPLPGGSGGFAPATVDTERGTTPIASPAGAPSAPASRPAPQPAYEGQPQYGGDSLDNMWDGLVKKLTGR